MKCWSGMRLAVAPANPQVDGRRSSGTRSDIAVIDVVSTGNMAAR
jgi:hypothetical protein